jgi:cyclic beta-1,2-glucan synthetase
MTDTSALPSSYRSCVLPRTSIESDFPERPLRDELLSADQLERYAGHLATSHSLAAGKEADKLINRLTENEKVLQSTYDLVAAAITRNRRIDPAAEWLLDNFYLLEEQIHSTRRLLPRSYSQELPRLAGGPAAGYPRVYGISLELISHTDGRVDSQALDGFIAAYQSVVPLQLGELWALPLMIRLALIENLRRIASRIAIARQERDLASDWADKMIVTVEQCPSDLILVLADMARSNPPLSGAFLADLTRNLHGQNPNFAIVHSWLENRLNDTGLATEQLVLNEGQVQAAEQISVGNCITSLRFLSVHDWPQFVASQSLVEQTLNRDPSGIYPKMDFRTRNRYRHAVEAIARRSELSEFDVAFRAIQLSENEPASSTNSHMRHVGYYLVDKGRPVLEKLVQMRLTASVVFDKLRRTFPLSIYLLSVLVFTWLGIAGLFSFGDWGSSSPWLLLMVAIPIFMCGVQFGLGVVNWLCTVLMRPQALPRMDFGDGIPEEHRTCVVVPSMLSGIDSIDRLLEGLEIRYLANRDASLQFVLLTDFLDADCEVMACDQEFVAHAQRGIDRLNQDYRRHGRDTFFLLNRSRKWNESEGTWMGFERKRGKLADFNASLRGANDRFSSSCGKLEDLKQIQYVITLDTDTQLPRDAARKLVEAMAHPLNRPRLDPKNGLVTAGYTILQPRVAISMTSTRRSWFVRLVGSDPSIDPYTQVVSDVYQDLFGEGSFIGKGIYDVDAFEKCCGNFPVNAILSHDLLESCFGRSALISDVTLYEDHPSSYMADVSRRHRWIRGDWQIAGWLLPRIRANHSAPVSNPITALSWWKIFDNLRRSLMPIAMVALLLCSWLFASSSAALATTWFVVLVVAAPRIMAALIDFAFKPTDLSLATHLHSVVKASIRPIAQSLFSLAFLPYDVKVNSDAIVRTIYRVNWTKRRLLEWRTSSDSELNANSALFGFWRTMMVAPLVALVAFITISFFNPGTLAVAAPWLFFWLVSPSIAWWLSRPIPVPLVRLKAPQRQFLRNMARRTWRYFEVFVNEDSNWLPPDNVHVNPREFVAHRTSPTNIGMALLADLAATDFGYCSVQRLLNRTRNTFQTLTKLEKYRGHFLNWYDTRTSLPLLPRYVSTVDSGNLAGHLRVMAAGLDQMVDASIVPNKIFEGLYDTLDVLLEEMATITPRIGDVAKRLVGSATTRRIEQQMAILSSRSPDLRSSLDLLPKLKEEIDQFNETLLADTEPVWWSNAFTQTCDEQLAELRTMGQWSTMAMPALPSELVWGQQTHAIVEALKQLHFQIEELQACPTLRCIASMPETFCVMIDSVRLLILETRRTEPLSSSPIHEIAGKTSVTSQDLTIVAWLDAVSNSMMEAADFAGNRMGELKRLADDCRGFADMDFQFLESNLRDLFAIGFNVTENQLDTGCYDLMASEARLATYVLIAQGQLGQEHWFALGRLLTSTKGEPALLSWTGSMFEYLMPLLVMPTYDHTLLDQTYRAVVSRQMEYGRQRGVPWGVSECGYNAFDLNLNYQYRAFGVPGLGLKRGLAEDLVIAPYASALALMVAPEAACKNLERLAREDRAGKFGFYEAIDYTVSRLPPGTNSVTIRQYMAHHAGMSLLSFAYVLLDKPMQRRFSSDLALRSTELLLQERVPRNTVPLFPHANEANATRTATAEESGTMRVISDPATAAPDVHLLSNGQYHVAISSAGAGYSRWRGLSVTRWREDPTRDCWGNFCYIRDLDSGGLWSTAWQPTTKAADKYEAIFTQARAEFRRVDEQIEMHTMISVASEDDLEIRRTKLTNRSERVRRIEVTSYAEVVLAPQSHDESHPAFSNLFVQTELLPLSGAILCTRRPRSAEEQPPWMIHMMTATGTQGDETSYETDRMRFLGRGKSPASPAAFDSRNPLSNSQGATLDPMVSVRKTILLQPNETVTVDVITGVGESKAIATGMIEKYKDTILADRVFELAWTRGLIMLQQLNASESEALTYSRLAGSVLYATGFRRAKESVLLQNRRGQSGLWSYGISGDLPIVLIRIRNAENTDLVREVVRAHAYWRMKGLVVDLVIWNEDDSVYRQSLQESILDIVSASPGAALLDRPGGVFVRRGEHMSDEDRALLQTVARIVLEDDAGTLTDQVNRRIRPEMAMPRFRSSRTHMDIITQPEAAKRDLAFYNGIGGFSRDGREYVVMLKPGDATPAPWVNTIANSKIGTVVSESGSAYTWSENSHEFRLTTWSNDPVSDTSSEAIYLRDEETGKFWSPSPLPTRGTGTYVSRHGFGYSIFDYTEDGITTELCIYVSIDEPIKYARLKVTNHSGRQRSISITGYWEWVLGEVRSKSHMHVATDIDSVTNAIFARNPYSPEFADRIAFVDCSESTRTITCDRSEFLGRNRSPSNPAAMHRTRLSNRVGAGLDPCAAIQTQVTIEDKHEKTVMFTIGSAKSEAEARQLILKTRDTDGGYQALEKVWHYWSQTLGSISIETPDPAVNFLANGWLIYQTLTCRMWARSGFYQSGGAFGFRDQLQDAMALIHTEPNLFRDQILLAASRQFREGDVQHWWHPPVGRGVRTHFSDDLLWLPFALCRYVQTTGDAALLNEPIPYLTSRLLHEDEEANYDLPQVSEDIGSVYDHALRAIDHSMQFGAHGLPLMGCGDWNDGMNLVGKNGKGESVWLAFFLYEVLNQFATLARTREDSGTADRLELEAGRLRGNIEQSGWDGQWYRRAYFDDGTPLGSSQNQECQIDSISQSWSVLSGAGTQDRTAIAMESLYTRLVRPNDGIVLLLDPPFDHSELNPGYIKGYVPGVRENGGQYTHGAIWTAMAFAKLGDTDRAWEIFSLINPIHHGSTASGIDKYRVEPYVVAADVYGVEPHLGRGGWTWYTGSAGWMYRLIIESLLGLHLEVDKLRFCPRPPRNWPWFKMHYRYRETSYHITVTCNGHGNMIQSLCLDGVEQVEHCVCLVDDKASHHVEIVLGPTSGK